MGGSDLVKIREQLGDNADKEYDYLFSENGLMAFKKGQLLKATSFKDHLGEEKLKKLLNFILIYIANLDIPIKRGTFIEFRNGMLNVSPIGRNCSQEERDAFEEYDKEAKVRETMVGIMREKFAHMDLTCAPNWPCCCSCACCCWRRSAFAQAAGGESGQGRSRVEQPPPSTTAAAEPRLEPPLPPLPPGPRPEGWWLRSTRRGPRGSADSTEQLP